MSNVTQITSADSIQRAQAEYLWGLLDAERWTYRKLEGRTGIKVGVISSRMRGVTPITIGEVQTFAEVLHLDPVELYRGILAAGNGEKAPTPKGGDLSVPPTGIEPATFGTNVRRFPTERVRPAHDVTPRPVIAIGGTR